MKKNFEKLVSLIGMCSLVFCMTACGNSTTTETTQKTANTQTAENTQTSETTEASQTEQSVAATESSSDLLDVIKERGYVVVGTEGTWRPYTYHDEEDNLVGFDVELAKYIADYIGVDIQYSETVWSSMFASLDSGQVDMVVNSVMYTDERAEKYDFSEPYNYAQYAILTKADNDEINSLEDVQGKKAANNPTSTIGAFAESSGCVLDDVGEMAQSIGEVLNGRADVTFNTVASYTDYLNQYPENTDKVKIITVTDPMPNAYIPVLKGNDKLAAAVNEALEAAKADGTLSDLAVKYFGVDTTDPSGTK